MNIEKVVCDAENLFKASQKVIKTSPNKQSTVYFRRKRLSEIKRAQEELHAMTWEIKPMKPFLLNERGHQRKIIGNTPYDRMIIHSYIDYGLEPLLRKHLIYDNYASQTGKGTSLARKRFKDFLNRAYREYGHNRIYVLLIDFAKFYDNVQHEKLKAEILRKIPYDPFHEYMLTTILKSMETDVSFMTDEEYEHCMETKYSALDHLTEHRKEKFMPKGLQIGNQASQLFSIYYPTRIDTFLRCTEGLKYHGRYMDDTFIIHSDKTYLRALTERVRDIAEEMGIFIHDRKTQISRADKGVKFLNRMYRVDDYGCVSERILSSTVTRERRKLKKFKTMLDDGSMTYAKIDNQYRPWMGNFGQYMSGKQRNELNHLYNELFINDWKGEPYDTESKR